MWPASSPSVSMRCSETARRAATVSCAWSVSLRQVDQTIVPTVTRSLTISRHGMPVTGNSLGIPSTGVCSTNPSIIQTPLRLGGIAIVRLSTASQRHTLQVRVLPISRLPFLRKSSRIVINTRRSSHARYDSAFSPHPFDPHRNSHVAMPLIASNRSPTTTHQPRPPTRTSIPANHRPLTLLCSSEQRHFKRSLCSSIST